MFDFHIHSYVSFDSQSDPLEVCAAAVKRGLKEICFTDHYDENPDPMGLCYRFSIEAYNAAYDNLSYPGLRIRRGVEVGLTADNQDFVRQLLSLRDFDYVIGSSHFVDGLDPYESRFWEGRTPRASIARYLEATLETVSRQEEFDVLGHLTYPSKSPCNPTGQPALYSDHREVIDEILRVLIAKGKGMEINTSGVDRVGVFLPDEAVVRRYHQLGGEIITIGSDAHTPDRVGQYTDRATQLCREVFGYVCTFENRQPVFHKL